MKSLEKESHKSKNQSWSGATKKSRKAKRSNARHVLKLKLKKEKI